MGVLTIPAPVGGINIFNQTDPRFANDLHEWIPRAGYLELRHGFTAIDTTLNALTIHEWSGADGNNYLVVGTATTLNKMTRTGTITSLETGMTNGLWQSTMFQNKLILTNAADTPQVFDGTSTTDIVVTGVTATTLWGCHTFKGRVYYWKKNDSSFWYAAAGSYQGALTEFPLNTVISRGGFLVSMATIEQQGGEGADDLAVFIFSTGEIVIYQGDDPAAARSWQMIGKMKIGKPISQYATCKVGATVLVWTTDGITDLSSVLNAGSVTQQSILSFPLGPSAANITPVFTGTAIPKTAYFAKESLFIALQANSGGGAISYVYETNSKAWTTWTVALQYVTGGSNLGDYTACAAVIGDEYFIGGDAGVLRYTTTAAKDGAYTTAFLTPYVNIVAYSRQVNIKLQNGRTGLITTVSPRTNYDNVRYLACRVTGDMKGFLYRYPFITTDIEADPRTNAASLGSTLFLSVTNPMFGVVVQEPSEGFQISMTLAQQAASPVRWYETRLGWKMGGSR